MSKVPEIRTKRAYLPADDEDGQRILVDRLWPRGISRDKLAAVSVSYTHLTLPTILRV